GHLGHGAISHESSPPAMLFPVRQDSREFDAVVVRPVGRRLVHAPRAATDHADQRTIDAKRSDRLLNQPASTLGVRKMRTGNDNAPKLHSMAHNRAPPTPKLRLVLGEHP